MRIVIRVSHPAHVHKFKYLIGKLLKDHSVFVVVIEKEMTSYLLNKYGISYYTAGRNSRGLVRKFFGLLLQITRLTFRLSKFRPDLFIGGGDPLLAIVSWIYKKPYIAFEDTEVANLILLFYRKIAAAILTPSSFYKDLGSRQIRYKGFHELAYLNPEFFVPDKDVLKYLDLKINEKYAVIRFVSWQASHDIGVNRLSNQEKTDLVLELSKTIRVYISSESDMPNIIAKFKIEIPPEKIHDVLFFASVYIGEGATMASESALMGTPAIYTNPLNAGIIDEEERAGLLYHRSNYDEIIALSKMIIEDEDIKEKTRVKAVDFINSKISVTNLWYWFVSTFPDSYKILKKDPDFQDEFKTTQNYPKG